MTKKYTLLTLSCLLAITSCDNHYERIARANNMSLVNVRMYYLLRAIDSGDVNKVEEEIKKGVYLNQPINDRKNGKVISALEYAMRIGNNDIAAILVKYGAEINDLGYGDNATNFAYIHGRCVIANALNMARGQTIKGDINKLTERVLKNYLDNNTDRECVNFFIRKHLKQIDINYKNDDGDGFLHIIVKHKNAEKTGQYVAGLFFNKHRGGDINILNKDNATPRDLAEYYGNNLLKTFRFTTKN